MVARATTALVSWRKQIVDRTSAATTGDLDIRLYSLFAGIDNIVKQVLVDFQTAHHFFTTDAISARII